MKQQIIADNKKTLSVAAIKDGTVIDHISAGRALQIIRLLNVAANGRQVTVGLNLPSKTMARKDIIKVEGKELTKNEVDQIAIISPAASINIIHDYHVKEKFKVTLPEKISHLIVCPNPKCITNSERMETNFFIINEKKEVQVRCFYCEKIFHQEEIRDYNS